MFQPVRNRCTWAVFAAMVVSVGTCALAEVKSEAATSESKQIERIGPYRPRHKPDLRTVEAAIVQQTNAFRESEVLAPVKENAALAKAARDFAMFMAKHDLYGHRADDRGPAERAEEAGYDYCLVLENIAYRFRTRGFTTEQLAEGLVTGWRESPPHRKNMLEPDVTETGVGVAQSSKTHTFYAVQLFGRPESAAIQFALFNEGNKTAFYSLGERDCRRATNARTPFAAGQSCM